MVKLTLQKGEATHDWFVHDPRAVRWSAKRVYNHFYTKVSETYGKKMIILSIVDDETGKVLWTRN